MKYCQYHPLEAATYYCPHCNQHHCDHCIDEGDQGNNSQCFKCNTACESLGASYNAEPFWRRFQESFRYPLTKETIFFIIAIALLNSIVVYLPFAIIWILMLMGIFMKYCFTCLERTAKGIIHPPQITAAYDGGIVLAIKLIAIILIMGLSIFGMQQWLGQGIASLFGMILICCSPAIIINFSLSEQVTDAINPLKTLALISAVGLPYGLLLAIIMVMLGSVGFINEILGQNTSFISHILQAAIGNYYTIVLFHLMGCMLFQYQGQLGFIARHNDDELNTGRGKVERLLAHIDILVKEGEYTKVLPLFQKGLKQHPNDKKLYERCFEFLLATKDKQLIDDFLNLYLNLLRQQQRLDQVSLVYKRSLAVFPKFIPSRGDDRLLIAKECYNGGDSRSCFDLLNGFHKEFPQHPKLIQALELQATALRDLPNKEKQADQFDLLIKRFKKQKQQKQLKPKRENSLQPLSIEERIEANADKANIENQGLTSSKPTSQHSEDKAKSGGSIDYDGGIDFKP